MSTATQALSPTTPTPRLVVDANLDGIVSIPPLTDPRAPADQTHEGRPFVHWINDDQDDRAWYETVPVRKPDLNDEQPNSLRDLEDLERLQVDLFDLHYQRTPITGTLTLSWSDLQGTPGIRLFADADPDCSGRYLTHDEHAAQQLEAPFLNALGQVLPDQPLQIDLATFQTQADQAGRLCLLFEGSAMGNGLLAGTIALGDGAPIELQPVHLELRPVKSLYQRVRVRWPGDKPPWAYLSEQPPELEMQWELDPMEHPFVAPWYQSDDVIVMVVGWTRETRDGYRKSLIEALETTYKRLRHRGFKGRFDVFRWDTRKYLMAFGLKESEYRAFKSGGPLMDYVHSLTADSESVHVMGHSQGGIVLLEALKLGMAAQSALFLQTVVPAETLDPDVELFYPGAESIKSPDTSEDLGYRGYVSEVNTPVFNFFNQQDIAFMGWDSVQKGFKPNRSLTRGYYFAPDRDSGEKVYLRAWGTEQRTVTDPHESMALAALPRTYALGAEPRVRGVVSESFDLNADGLDFGVEHGAQFSRNVQQTTAFYDLLLDTFNLPFRGVEP